MTTAETTNITAATNAAVTTPTVKKVKAATVKVVVAKAKKIASSAAVIPMVNTKGKQVFLKIAKANADKSIPAAIAALKDKKIDYFDGAAKAFVKEHGFEAITIWVSRIAQVQPGRVAKSATNQVAFWSRNGYTVMNKDDFIAEAAAVSADAKTEAVAADVTDDAAAVPA